MYSTITWNISTMKLCFHIKVGYVGRDYKYSRLRQSGGGVRQYIQ